MNPVTLEEEISQNLTARASARSQHRRWTLVPGPMAFIFCLTNAVVFTAVVGRFLKGTQLYTDVVSGPLAWSNADKGLDFRVFYVFLLAFFLLFTLLVFLCWRLQRIPEIKSALERSLALALTPAALWFGTRLPTNKLDGAPIESLIAATAVIVLFFSVSRTRLFVTADEVFTIITRSLLVLLFAFFGGLGLATLISRGFGMPIGEPVALAPSMTILAAMLITTTWTICASSFAAEIHDRLRSIFFGAQFFLPLLWLVVIPPAIVQNGHQVGPSSPVLLVAAIALMITISWGALLRRWLTQPKLGSTDLRQNLVAFAIVPIAVFVATNHTVFPTFFGDDFHTGEHLLPWQQFHDFGKIPFIDFVPIHPLMDFLVSGVNTLFFDGTLANYENSRAILFALGAAVTFLCVEQFAGIGLALCLSMVANLWDRLLFVPAILIVLCGERLIARSEKWLIAWCCICPITLFYNPAVGVALILASFPIALAQVRQLVIQDRNAFLRLIGVSGSIALILILVPVTRRICFGFAHFLIENARTVTLAHAIEWEAAIGKGFSEKLLLAAPFVWEVLRFSWVIVLLISAWIFVSRAMDWRNAPRSVLALSLTSCLFLFFLSGWTINRIDFNEASRTGEVSYLACLYILPLLLFAAAPGRSFPSLLFLLVAGFFQGGLADFLNSGSKPHQPATAKTLVDKSALVLTVPPQCIPFDGPSLDLPNVGQIYAPKEVLASLMILKSAVNELLQPGETYLDLTGWQANYFYLGRPVAVSYGSPWLAASTALQDELLGQIKSRPPPVVWLAPMFFGEGDNPALRNYKLYRFLIENYVPVSRSGLIFLVAPARGHGSDFTRKGDLKLIREAFGKDSLGGLPSAWGSSWDNIQNRFISIQKPSATEMPTLSEGESALSFGDGLVSGAKSDFIKFDFWSNLSPNAKLNLEITWVSENGSGTARLVATNGTQLVPIGVFPEWLLSKEISRIRIQPCPPLRGLKYVIRNPELLRLKD